MNIRNVWPLNRKATWSFLILSVSTIASQLAVYLGHFYLSLILFVPAGLVLLPFIFPALGRTSPKSDVLALLLTLGVLLSAAPALAQQPQAPQGQADQVKTDAKTKKAKKVYRGDDFGDIHEGAKKYGVDTSKPESLKGRNVSGEMAKRVKL